MNPLNQLYDLNQVKQLSPRILLQLLPTNEIAQLTHKDTDFIDKLKNSTNPDYSSINIEAIQNKIQSIFNNKKKYDESFYYRGVQISKISKPKNIKDVIKYFGNNNLAKLLNVNTALINQYSSDNYAPPKNSANIYNLYKNQQELLNYAVKAESELTAKLQIDDLDIFNKIEYLGYKHSSDLLNKSISSIKRWKHNRKIPNNIDVSKVDKEFKKRFIDSIKNLPDNNFHNFDNYKEWSLQEKINFLTPKDISIITGKHINTIYSWLKNNKKISAAESRKINTLLYQRLKYVNPENLSKKILNKNKIDFNKNAYLLSQKNKYIDKKSSEEKITDTTIISDSQNRSITIDSKYISSLTIKGSGFDDFKYFERTTPVKSLFKGKIMVLESSGWMEKNRDNIHCMLDPIECNELLELWLDNAVDEVKSLLEGFFLERYFHYNVADILIVSGVCEIS